MILLLYICWSLFTLYALFYISSFPFIPQNHVSRVMRILYALAEPDQSYAYEIDVYLGWLFQLATNVYITSAPLGEKDVEMTGRKPVKHYSKSPARMYHGNDRRSCFCGHVVFSGI